jgi:hypothetical protein
MPILKPPAWNVVAPALAEKHTLLANVEEVTSARISGFTSCNCHPVSVISETGMKVGLSLNGLFMVSSSCHTVMPVDINLKYDGQQQE